MHTPNLYHKRENYPHLNQKPQPEPEKPQPEPEKPQPEPEKPVDDSAKQREEEEARKKAEEEARKKAEEEARKNDEAVKAAQSKVNEAKAKLEEAKLALQKANEVVMAGVKGFYEKYGDKEALKVLETHKDLLIKDATDKNSTLNIDNVIKSVETLKPINQRRITDDLKPGLAELKVDSYLMAVAQVQTIKGAQIIDNNKKTGATDSPHSNLYNVGENLAFGTDLKRSVSAWYDEEKFAYENRELDDEAYFKAFKAKFGFNRRDRKIGHYFNIITEYTVVGAAFDVPSEYFRIAAGTTFSYSATDNALSVDEYLKRLNDYKTEIINNQLKAEDAFDSASEALIKAEQALKDAVEASKKKIKYVATKQLDDLITSYWKENHEVDTNTSDIYNKLDKDTDLKEKRKAYEDFIYNDVFPKIGNNKELSEDEFNALKDKVNFLHDEFLKVRDKAVKRERLLGDYGKFYYAIKKNTYNGLIYHEAISSELKKYEAEYESIKELVDSKESFTDEEKRAILERLSIADSALEKVYENVILPLEKKDTKFDVKTTIVDTYGFWRIERIGHLDLDSAKRHLDILNNFRGEGKELVLDETLTKIANVRAKQLYNPIEYAELIDDADSELLDKDYDKAVNYFMKHKIVTDENEVFTEFKMSPLQSENLVNPNFKKVGIAVFYVKAIDTEGLIYYFTQTVYVFGK